VHVWGWQLSRHGQLKTSDRAYSACFAAGPASIDGALLYSHGKIFLKKTLAMFTIFSEYGVDVMGRTEKGLAVGSDNGIWNENQRSKNEEGNDGL